MNENKMIEVLEKAAANNRDAHTLLDLINAEFESDPMSTQCFDSRIVDRVRQCVKDHTLVFKMLKDIKSGG